MLSRTWWVCLFVAAGVRCAFGGDLFTRDAEPSWVEVATVDPGGDRAGRSGAVRYLVADAQVNLAVSSTYWHYAVELVSEEGVEDYAQLEFEVQKGYQTLVFHRIDITRGGVVQERLGEVEFHVAQREEKMEDAIYDGEQTIYTILKDVRPGDILSYSYTVAGNNPVFDGESHGFLKLEFGVPVGTVRRRVLWDPGHHPVRWKVHGGLAGSDGQVKEAPGQLEWRQEDVEVPEIEEDTPHRVYDYSWLEYSTYPGWREYGAWERKLFERPAALPGEVVEACAEIRAAGKTGAEEIVEALRWVQRNIRYLGSFLGGHTHVPHALDTIVENRYGDCKDQSLLLVAMLEEMGFDAAPALVNTSTRAAVGEYLPGYAGFDHVIVHVLHEGDDYYLDPTTTLQRGTLEEVWLPDYGFAFVVRPGEEAPRPVVVRGRAAGSVTLTETYVIESLDGGATLEVVTVATGREADSLRSHFADDPLEEIGEEYLDFYSGDWEGIELAEPVRFEDSESANRFTTWERYRIPEFWEGPGSGEGRWGANLSASYLESLLELPEAQSRRHPYATGRTRNITQHIDVTFPEDWPCSFPTVEIGHPAFSYRSDVVSRDDGFRATFGYASLAGEVQPGDFESYREKIGEVFDDLSIYVSHEGRPGTGATGYVGPGSGVAYLVLGAVVVAGLAVGLVAGLGMYFYDPAPRRIEVPFPVGLGGWMVLPVIGTVLSPVVVAGYLVLLFAGVGEAGDFTDGAGSLEPSGRYLVVTGFLYAVFLVPSLVLAVLLFRRRSSFPVCFFGLAVFDAGVTSSAFFLSRGTGDADLPEVGSSLVYALVWGIYMYRSRRVKATFLKRR